MFASGSRGRSAAAAAEPPLQVQSGDVHWWDVDEERCPESQSCGNQKQIQSPNLYVDWYQKSTSRLLGQAHDPFRRRVLSDD